jgi:[protein-PII] uridylyltransferase
MPAETGIALAAVGALARREPMPGSDLDLVLLHDGPSAQVAEVADAIWYPIWDSGVGLDHSVRTPDQAIAVARADVKALLGLLDVRHVGGDPAVTATLRERALDLWRASAARRLPDIRDLAQARWRLAGDAAHLLEPNLKDSRGGLRDAHLLRAYALAQLVDLPVSVRTATTELLDIRAELHRAAGRAEEVLRRQEHEAVATALGLGANPTTPAADVVLWRVNRAARTVAHGLDTAWRRVESQRSPSSWRRVLGGAAAPERHGLARDVVAQDGEVVLARDALPAHDAGLVLRVARAAAEHRLPISEFTVERLSAEVAPMPEPWPAAVRDDLVSLLATGDAAVPVVEALDLGGLLGRLVPEWAAVRCRAQHNPVHRFTVDRHLLETAARATEHTREVSRPDLLLVGALLHDIGKGYPGDHSVVGAGVAERISRRIGFNPADATIIAAMARHHLLLPDTATRRDLDDPLTVAAVTDAVGDSAQLLELLHALSVADAAATGPGAWSEWKAGLVADLVARCHAALAGAPPPRAPSLDPRLRELAEAGMTAVVVADDSVLVAAPDSVGVLYRTAGVLALHSLSVRSATICTHAGMAANSFAVEARFGRLPDARVVRADLERALDGEFRLAERLREKERSYRAASQAELRPPDVEWFDDAATDATVIEIRAEDEIGLLCRITAALDRCGLDVRSALVASLGGSVVDSFYVTMRGGGPVPAGARVDIEVELRGV